MISRRRMLMATAALAGSAALGTRSSVGAPNSHLKRIALLNLHTASAWTSNMAAMTPMQAMHWRRSRFY